MSESDLFAERQVLKARGFYLFFHQKRIGAFCFILCFISLLTGCAAEDDSAPPPGNAPGNTLGNAEMITDLSGIKADYQIRTAPSPAGEQPAQKTAGHIAQVNHDMIENEQIRTIGQALTYLP